MKKLQTFKFDPELIEELKEEAILVKRPFNNYVEMLLKGETDRMVVGKNLKKK